MIKKTRVAFLFDKRNNWISNFIKRDKFKRYNKKFSFNFFENKNKVKKFDIVFILGFTKILNKKFLQQNKLCLVIHESKLPLGRGFAPVQWQILKNKNKITVCLISINEKIDQGDIILKSIITFRGDELSDEIRFKQATASILLIKKFLKKFPHYILTKQKGKSTFYRRRNKFDSELNLNQSIKKQFNLLRICDNENYTAYFVFKKKKYVIKIFKAKNEKK